MFFNATVCSIPIGNFVGEWHILEWKYHWVMCKAIEKRLFYNLRFNIMVIFNLKWILKSQEDK